MDIPAKIQLHDGERWSTHLPGLCSVGYQWVYELESGVGVIEVTLAPLSSATAQSTAGEPPGNSNIDELLEIRAIKPGLAVIHLQQHRPWQADQPPLHEHRLEVLVKAEA